MTTFHCADGGEYARLADWQHRFLRRQFQAALAEHRPEIVHFHHFISLGDDLVRLVRASGAAVVYTLHDYGLICPNCLLLRSDGQLCQKRDADFFQDCCPVLIRTLRGPAPALAAQLPSLARWHLFANQFPNPAVRTLLDAGVGLAECVLGEPARTDIARKTEFFFRHTRRMFQDVDLFLAPSEFLRQRYLDCGIPSDKLLHVRLGVRQFERVAPAPSDGRLRFGYIGAWHSHKGVDVLLQAFRGLGDRASLHIYGSTFGSPISENYWRRVRQLPRAGVVIHGAYRNQDIGQILATLDAVIVPSVWYENSPLTIQEAFIGGVPVITSDRGGMAELVHDRVGGLQFNLGDAGDLRAKLVSLIDDPDLLPRLRSGIPPVPGIEQQAAIVRQQYERLTHSSGDFRGS